VEQRCGGAERDALNDPSGIVAMRFGYPFQIIAKDRLSALTSQYVVRDVVAALVVRVATPASCEPLDGLRLGTVDTSEGVSPGHPRLYQWRGLGSVPGAGDLGLELSEGGVAARQGDVEVSCVQGTDEEPLA
jgi:hypothetical protein